MSAEFNGMAYCPGDALKIQYVVADNQTSVALPGITINLVQIVQRTAKCKTTQ